MLPHRDSSTGLQHPILWLPHSFLNLALENIACLRSWGTFAGLICSDVITLFCAALVRLSIVFQVDYAERWTRRSLVLLPL